MGGWKRGGGREGVGQDGIQNGEEGEQASVRPPCSSPTGTESLV